MKSHAIRCFPQISYIYEGVAKTTFIKFLAELFRKIVKGEN